MACHPDEVDDITCHSAALALNLGNFDDVRAKSMMIKMCIRDRFSFGQLFLLLLGTFVAFVVSLFAIKALLNLSLIHI